MRIQVTEFIFQFPFHTIGNYLIVVEWRRLVKFDNTKACENTIDNYDDYEFLTMENHIEIHYELLNKLEREDMTGRYLASSLCSCQT